ncbi:uncharacterized protein Dana_GF17237 [Drosophila ananassae]|uniref:Uncharacterized protein n=1 Tax=Drosophila ananassae TaxID=7217 RepID=B3LZL8_DROAN|nr:glycerophosphocholine phosphodiesterase GPCPD1 [Drosophila ananassae]EDV41960.1 uncharacterized protein Dana_GF17237 [Drosophila ananassae]
MHRWFFANEREECEPKLEEIVEEAGDDDLNKRPVAPYVPTTEWPFCVSYHRKLAGNEYIAITGNCHNLGDWNPKEVYVMAKSECYDCMCMCHQYEAMVLIPRNIDIEYRYCVVAYDPELDEVYIRTWEAQLRPRVIRTCQNMLKQCDCFGHPNEDESDRVDRGWATTETIVHLRIFNAPFIWQGQQQRLLYVRVQPMFEVPEPDCVNDNVTKTSQVAPPRLSRYLADTDIISNDLKLRLAYVETVNLKETRPLNYQPKFGVRCGPADMQLFHCAIALPAETRYRIDLYTYANKAGLDEPAYHYGYGFLMPEQLEGSEGNARVKITCASTHRPLIEMNIKYLMIRPLENFSCDMSLCYERYWRKGRMSMNIGHRGSGNTYRIGQDIVRENTLFGFKQVAGANADMVEFDVQLTQDAQVVVFHDFVLRFLQQRTPTVDELLFNQDLIVFAYEKLNRLMLLSMGGSKRKDHIAVPLEAFTYEQLRGAKVLRFAGGKGCDLSCSQMLFEQRPFPLLLELFEQEDLLPTNLGFNIEIKWPQLDTSRRWEKGSFKPTFDRNFYVDTILEIVLKNAGKRRIIFSSFDADICTMIRYKQNLYPVALLTENHDSEVQYADERVRDLETAVQLANALEFFGLSLHATTVLKCPSTVAYLHQYHLHTMVWGKETTCLENRHRLKRMGVVGIIYDRLDQLDQAGEELEDIVCTIDSVTTRPMIQETELTEWRHKCGYKGSSTTETNPYA